jgi:hypothetical protein
MVLVHLLARAKSCWMRESMYVAQTYARQRLGRADKSRSTSKRLQALAPILTQIAVLGLLLSKSMDLSQTKMSNVPSYSGDEQTEEVR